jgi:hypothetical protein
MIGSASSALVTGFHDGGFGVGDRRRVVPCLSLESPPRWPESLRWHPGFVRVAHRPQRAERRSPALSTGGPCRVQA